MDTKYYLTMIIPCYNGANQLRNCLSSIFIEETEGIEIICVNDGSNGKESEKIEEVTKQFGVLLISIPHSGVSYARNIGLSNANGKYIWFIDCDDQIVVAAVKTIKDNFTRLVDVNVFGAKINNNDGSAYTLNDIIPTSKVIDNNCLQMFFDDASTKPYVWHKIYSREFLFLQQIKFDDDLDLGEDLLFCFQTLLSAKKVLFFSEPIYAYNYLQAKDSAMNDFLKQPTKRMRGHIVIVDKILSLLNPKQIRRIKNDLDNWIYDFVGEQIFIIFIIKKYDLFVEIRQAMWHNKYKLSRVSFKRKKQIKAQILNSKLLSAIWKKYAQNKYVEAGSK